MDRCLIHSLKLTETVFLWSPINHDYKAGPVVYLKQSDVNMQFETGTSTILQLSLLVVGKKELSFKMDSLTGILCTH